MNLIIIVCIALAGGCGASLRYFIDSKLPKKNFPTGTFTVNALGSLGLGIINGLAISGTLSTDIAVVLGGGFFGAFTTFSTASLEILQMISANSIKKAYFYLVSMLFTCVILACIGTLIFAY